MTAPRCPHDLGDPRTCAYCTPIPGLPAAAVFPVPDAGVAELTPTWGGVPGELGSGDDVEDPLADDPDVCAQDRRAVTATMRRRLRQAGWPV